MNKVLLGFIDSYAEDEKGVSAIPMKCQSTMDEVAATVRFLVSSDPSCITGQNIRVDDGLKLFLLMRLKR